MQVKEGTLQVNNSLVVGDVVTTPSRPTPAPNSKTAGNLYVNDVYLNNGGKWASQMSGGAAVQGTHCGQFSSGLTGGASQQQGTAPLCKCKVFSQVPCNGTNLVDPNWTASAGVHLLTSNYIGTPTYVCNACPPPPVTCPSGFQQIAGNTCIKT